MWLDDLLDFWFPLPQDKAADISTTHSDSESYLAAQDIPQDIPDSGGADPPKSVSGKQTSAPPDIPEMYLRPELIPITEPDGAAVEEAERVLRR